jgi:adenosylmethionine-8-amino-7-oxononanoate aminotransferase
MTLELFSNGDYMRYKNIEVTMAEAPSYINTTYNVTTSKGLIFKAESMAGVVYAVSGAKALESMYKMIDEYLDNNGR